MPAQASGPASSPSSGPGLGGVPAPRPEGPGPGPHAHPTLRPPQLLLFSLCPRTWLGRLSHSRHFSLRPPPRLFWGLQTAPARGPRTMPRRLWDGGGGRGAASGQTTRVQAPRPLWPPAQPRARHPGRTACPLGAAPGRRLSPPPSRPRPRRLRPSYRGTGPAAGPGGGPMGVTWLGQPACLWPPPPGLSCPVSCGAIREDLTPLSHV